MKGLAIRMKEEPVMKDIEELLLQVPDKGLRSF